MQVSWVILINFKEKIKFRFYRQKSQFCGKLNGAYMKNRYEKILQQDEDLWKAVSGAKFTDAFDKISWNVISPVLVLYTLWIVTESEKQGIKRLYFLARDGYQMYGIAETLCKARNNGIVCSYFFCSRYALRMAAYRFFDESAYDRLFIHAFRQTPGCMLGRAGFDDDEKKRVFDDIYFSCDRENEVLGRTAFDEFCTKVKASGVFREILCRKSEAAYLDTTEYIHSENMQDYDTVGIVDLGWTGSLQMTLRRLLDSEHIHTNLVGFYMGMLSKPPVKAHSIYCTWLFDEKDTFIKSWFSHNLLECICSAPHGMTIGYRKLMGRSCPILAKEENPVEVSQRLKTTIARMTDMLDVNMSCGERHKDIALRLLRKLMFSPTKEEVLALSCYNFCDDVGEQYHRSIIQHGKPMDFCRELLPFKLFYRDFTDGFYWYYGSVTASRIIFKMIYRYGYLMSGYIVMKLKGGGSRAGNISHHGRLQLPDKANADTGG